MWTDAQYKEATTTRVAYEWDWEELDEHDDIINHWHSDAIQHKPFEGRGELVLVASWGCPSEGIEDRQWAYVADGKLPETFDGGRRVPKRFHAELARFVAAGGQP